MMRNESSPQAKQLLRVEEVTTILRISRWTVYRWVESGRLRGTRIGLGSLRIFGDSVLALINDNCIGSRGEAMREPKLTTGKSERAIGAREQDHHVRQDRPARV